MKLAFKHAIAGILLISSAAASVAAKSVDCSAQWKAVELKALGALLSGDHATALHLIRPLADCGVAGAQVNLGDMYSEGLGVSRDYSKALKWYQRAADQSYAEGQFRVGEMYYLGKGVTQNYAAALKWFQRAADQENEYAQARLGDMYGKGEGAPQDYVRAYMWYVLAIGHNQVAFVKGLLALEARMTPEQMTEGSKLASEWKKAKRQPR